MERIYRKLYEDENLEDLRPLKSEDDVEEDSMGTNILSEEFELPLIRLKNNKTPSVDNLRAERIMESGHLIKERLFKLVKMIYVRNKKYTLRF